MAFFTDKFLNDRREELLRSVDRFQYQLNGGAWQTGTVNSKEIIGTNVVVFVNVPNFGQADTITGVRVYDINGARVTALTPPMAVTISISTTPRPNGA